MSTRPDPLLWTTASAGTPPLRSHRAGATTCGGRHVAGFAIDLTALGRATDAILDTMDQMSNVRVKDLDPPGTAVGHHELGAALLQFCERWDLGIENLEKDLLSMVDELARCLRAYSATDQAAAADFQGVIGRASGSDPGVA